MKSESAPSKTRNTRSTSSPPGIERHIQGNYAVGGIVAGDAVRLDDEASRLVARSGSWLPVPRIFSEVTRPFLCRSTMP